MRGCVAGVEGLGVSGRGTGARGGAWTLQGVAGRGSDARVFGVEVRGIWAVPLEGPRRACE